MSVPERLLARVVGDPRVAEAIAGDLAEEGARWHRLRLVALSFRFAFRRDRRRPLVPDPRSKPMTTLFQDVRYAGRVLLRQPGFTAIVVLTLAVGLGANAAVFAMVDAMLLRPQPSADVDAVVQIFETNLAQRDDRENVSPPNFFDWQRQATTVERLLATEWWDANVTDKSLEPEQVVGGRVSAGYFHDLRVRPTLGRGFVEGEDSPGRNHVVVVSHRLWQRRWAGAPALVGSTITIDGEAYTVVGIAPPGFQLPEGTDLWAPIVFDKEIATQRTRRYLSVIGRRKPGISVEDVQREMETIAARLERDHKDSNSGYGVNVMPLSKAMLDLGTPTVLVVFQFAVALVLLIAGANVANLLMVRGTARNRELALRVAVGASRWRVIRQLVVESVVLSVIGVVLALPVAAAGIRIIKAFMPPEIARWILGWNDIDVDGRMMGLTMIVGVAAGVVFGALPALRASRPDLASALKEGGRGSAGGRRRVLQGFVVAQLALALALLVAAGLATRGAVRLLTQNDGYDPHGVMSFTMALPEAAYKDAEARWRFYDRVIADVRVLPGVTSAAWTSGVPFGGNNSSRPIELEGRAPSKASERPQMATRAITPDYFAVIHASIVQGRGFTTADLAGAPAVAVIDRMMAERLWPGENPIGRRFRPTHIPDSAWLTVVGIASNVKYDWFDGYRPTYYTPYAQNTLSYASLVVRTTGDETAIAPAVRHVFRQLDAGLPLSDVHSLVRLRSLKTVGMQFVAGLMTSFAGIGLFLSAIGIYGVMAYSVSQRTREIGVRIALGATSREVMGRTLRDAMVLSGIGIGIGLVVAFGLSKVLAANLFGVVQLDVATFAIFAAVLALVTVAAAGVPARRAMRVDPIDALRAE